MSKFVDGFIRAGLTKKTQVQSKRIRQQNRDMEDMAHMLGTAVAQKIKAEQEAATNEELREEIGRLRQRVMDLEFSIDIRECHRLADEARTQYLMSLLDQICQDNGTNNPARLPAYKDPDTLRIPSGDRKGEAMTSADHAYLDAFVKNFVEHFAKKWPYIENWKDFLHGKISY
ncbi:hypothetical protein [Ruegeria arenilitoris]|uniref:hypothetical protein n=1 Tax=Ruegeria arenilitoris TaxID=1173585 RepID=UPI00148145FF|nr:hypothetical protein [Ruegeria arenilitoris]